MTVEFLPFTRPTLDEATIASVVDVMRSGWLTSGPKVKALEAALSEYCGGRPVRVANSGTATLEVGLIIAGVKTGDEVITTPMSWAATSNVIVRLGVKPVFVDICPRTRNIDLDKLEAAITPATKAIMPVDLAGLPVNRDRLYQIAAKHQLRVVEDAAQSFGASWNGQRIGAMGDLVSFSFHANKNLTTSEGGALVFNTEEEARLFELHRLQGVVRDSEGGMDVDVIGGKFNLTDIAAAIGLGQLPHLEAFTQRRRELARAYFQALQPLADDFGIELPVADFEQSNWHMFQILLPLEQLTISRGDFIRAMQGEHIGTGVHYPAIHLFTAYQRLGYRAGDFPRAEYVGARTLTLPLFPTMADSDVERVAAALRKLLAQYNK